MGLIFDSAELNFLSVLFLVFVLVYFYFSNKYNYWKRRNVPHLKPIPIFGNIFEVITIRTSLGKFLNDLYQKTKNHDYYGFYVFSKPAILINDPEMIKQVLVKDFNHFVNRNFEVSHGIDPIGHHNLFANYSPRWRKYRGNISPIFTSGKIKHMFGLVEEVANELVQKVNQEIKNHGNELEIKELTARYTTDIICTTVFGVKANCLLDPDSKFRHFGKKSFETTYNRAFELMILWLIPSLGNILRLRLFPKETAEFLGETFWNVMLYREENKTGRKDLIDLLIQLKNKGIIDQPIMEESDKMEIEKVEKDFLLSRSEILSAAITFFTAGFETTASAITFILYELALHQDIQDRVREEILQGIAKEGKITYDVIQEAKLLGGCFDEVQRKYPLLPFLDRKCTETYRVPNSDLVIEKGTSIWISLDGLHKNPKYFPNPDKFDPERFVDERKNEVNPFTYMPFGQGPRNCIGMRFGIVNAKNGLAHILTNFKITPSPNTPHTIDFTPKSFLNTPKNDLKMIFTPIKK